jgi:hypothetical protein
MAPIHAPTTDRVAGRDPHQPAAAAQTIAPEVHPKRHLFHFWRHFLEMSAAMWIGMVVGKDIGVRVKELEPHRRMLWWDEKGEYSWEWLLEPIDQQTTRLLNRLRVTRHPWTWKLLYELVAANGDVVMQRKLLRGIKQRAERLAAQRRIPGQETGPS